MAIHINSIIITAEEENTRLDRYLVNSLNVPQSLIQKDLRKGLIKVNDKKSTANYRVQETDIIQLFKDYSGKICLLYTSPSPRDATLSRMPSSA